MRLNRFKKVAAVALCVVLFVSSLAVFSVYASAPSGSVHIVTLDREKDQAIAATYRLYTVANAEVSGNNATFTYTDAFKGNGMELEQLGDASFALHLAVYAANHNLPYAEKAADENGVAIFDGLPIGAYLVVPAEMEQGYIPASPLLVYLPKIVNGEWQYDEECTPKIQAKIENPQPVKMVVQKKWKGSSNHPENITVSLVKDGKAVETVTLNAQNDWYYLWSNLEGNHAWNVVELNVPADYRASYESSEGLVVITNTNDLPPQDEPSMPNTGQLN